RGSLELVGFDHVEHFFHVVQVADQRLAQRSYARPKPMRRLGIFETFQSLSQGIVNDLLQRHSPPVSYSFQPRTDVVVERQRRSHTSKHRINDVLMPAPREEAALYDNTQ